MLIFLAAALSGAGAGTSQLNSAQNRVIFRGLNSGYLIRVFEYSIHHRDKAACIDDVCVLTGGDPRRHTLSVSGGG